MRRGFKLSKIAKAIAWLDAMENDYAWSLVKAKLDEADAEDIFGTEGWKHWMGVE